MKLSTITTILFSGVALTIAAEVGAPLKARQAQAQACSFTGFKGTGFTGNSQPFSGDVCVSNYHLFTGDCELANININGLVL